jgi:hypothetical protein
MDHVMGWPRYIPIIILLAKKLLIGLSELGIYNSCNFYYKDLSNYSLSN